LDYLLALKRHSGFDVSYVHVTHDAIMDFNLNEFDVIFHNYCSRFCFEGYVSKSYRNALLNFHGLKLIAIQDEYDLTNILKAAIAELGFHVVLTCVPLDSLEYVYPKAEFPNVTFERVLTGYVPDDLVKDLIEPLPLIHRPITVGYRGRALPPYYGKLGFEKARIGEKMKEICLARGIVHDIAIDEASRIYGTAWLDFVGSCRTMLGSESGSNLFDFDGTIRAKYEELSRAQGAPLSYEEFVPVIGERDSMIDMGQVSPRVFECAAMRTPMILFRGRYSDVIEPDDHYIPLEKDFRNADEVIEKLQDIAGLEAMAERTYNHVVASGRFGYRAFGQKIGRLIEAEMAARGFAAIRPSEPIDSPVRRRWSDYLVPEILTRDPALSPRRTLVPNT
jgi:hypothetical protein